MVKKIKIHFPDPLYSAADTELRLKGYGLVDGATRKKLYCAFTAGRGPDGFAHAVFRRLVVRYYGRWRSLRIDPGPENFAFAYDQLREGGRVWLGTSTRNTPVQRFWRQGLGILRRGAGLGIFQIGNLCAKS